MSKYMKFAIALRLVNSLEQLHKTDDKILEALVNGTITRAERKDLLKIYDNKVIKFHKSKP